MYRKSLQLTQFSAIWQCKCKKEQAKVFAKIHADSANSILLRHHLIDWGNHRLWFPYIFHIKSQNFAKIEGFRWSVKNWITRRTNSLNVNIQLIFSIKHCFVSKMVENRNQNKLFDTSIINKYVYFACKVSALEIELY